MTQATLIVVMGAMLVLVIAFRDNVANGVANFFGSYSPPLQDSDAGHSPDSGEGAPSRLNIGAEENADGEALERKGGEPATIVDNREDPDAGPPPDVAGATPKQGEEPEIADE